MDVSCLAIIICVMMKWNHEELKQMDEMNLDWSAEGVILA